MNEFTSTGFPSRDFRMAAQNRRCGWYCLAGAVVLIGVAVWVRFFVIETPFNSGQLAALVFWSVLIFGGAGGLLLFIYRWRLRFDERGIWLRRYLSWDLWTWEEFEAGTIRRNGKNFVSMPRPMWRDKLVTDFLDEPDQEFVLRACRAFYNAPADEFHVGELPESLSFHWRFSFRVYLRAEGVRIEEQGLRGMRLIDEPWDHVREVRLFRFDHWSSEIVKLEFAFESRTVSIDGFIHQCSPPAAFDRRLRGAFHPVIEHFLRDHVPEGKLAYYALHGPPRSAAERDHRIKIAQGRIHVCRWIMWTVPAGMLLASGVCMGPKMIAAWANPQGIPFGWLLVATICGALSFSMHSIMIWALCHSVISRETKTVRELEAWQAPQREPQPIGLG